MTKYNNKDSLNISDFEISKVDIFAPSSFSNSKWGLSKNCPSDLSSLKRVTGHHRFPADLGQRIITACSLSYPLYSDTAAAQRSLLFSTDKLESIDTDIDMDKELERAADDMVLEAEILGGINMEDILDDGDTRSMTPIGEEHEGGNNDFVFGNWSECHSRGYSPGIPVANLISVSPNISARIGGSYNGQVGMSLTLSDYWAGKEELTDIPERFNGYVVGDLIDIVKSGMDNYLDWIIYEEENELNPGEYELAFFTARTLIYVLNRLCTGKRKRLTDKTVTDELVASITAETGEIDALINQLLVSDVTLGSRMKSDVIWGAMRMSAHAFNHGKQTAQKERPPARSHSSDRTLMIELGKIMSVVTTLDKRIASKEKEEGGSAQMFQDMIHEKCNSLEAASKKTAESINALTAQINNATKVMSQANFAEKEHTLKGDYRTGAASGAVKKTPKVAAEAPLPDDRQDYDAWFKSFVEKYHSVQEEFDMTPKDMEVMEFICKKKGYAPTAHNVMILCLLNGKIPKMGLSKKLRNFLIEARNVDTSKRFQWGLDALGEIKKVHVRKYDTTLRPPQAVSRTASGTKITDSIWD